VAEEAQKQSSMAASGTSAERRKRGSLKKAEEASRRKLYQCRSQ